MAAASENAENSEENNPVDEAELEVSDVDNNKIRLEGLKVVDLKNELEKRNLDKNGVKAVLIERLKSAIEKEGGNLEEYNFENSSDSNKSPLKKEKEGENLEECNFETSDSNKSPLKKEVELIETNGSIDTSDKLSIHEEKIDLTLQLSLDEEEAQLNEEESFIDLPKHSGNEIKVDDKVQPENDLSTREKSPVTEQNKANVTPTKVLKSSGEDTKKKSSKSTLESINEGLSSPATKTVKVTVGKKENLKSPNNMARCLWITGIPDTTRAADLKTLLSKQGRVIAVKVIKNAKQKPSKCYGFVTMSTSKDASKAIQNLHRTELNGHTISVEKAKCEPGTLLKKSERSQVFFGAKKPSSIKKEIVTPKKAVVVEKESKTECKETSKEESKTIVSKPSTEDSAKKKDEKNNATDKDKSKDKDRKSREHREREKDTHRPIRRPASFKPRIFGYDKPHYGGYKPPFSRRPFVNNRVGFGSSFRPRPSLVDLQKMREERYQRERFRERREAEHRRADEISRHRYIERKQREEAYRLEREKDKLRIERELLEKERTEILKLEREKHRLERERIEHEREELRRQAELRRGAKRPFSRIERESDPLWEERKKAARYEGRASFHSEASSSSRFEFTTRDRASYIRDYERPPERFSSQKQMESLHRADFDRDARREVTIRSREERRVFSRNDFRGRDNRRSFSSRERERHLSSRRETSRDEWKHDRRVHERIISPSNTSAQRRMTYY